MNEETLKIISTLFMPIALLVLGVWLKQIAAKHEQRASLHNRIIEKRLAIYNDIGTDLNDIYVFLLQVGHWKQLTPDLVLEKKRAIDKIMYVHKPYWSENLFQAFELFMQTAFETYTGVGEDAKLRTNSDELSSSPLWQTTWQDSFSKNDSSKADIRYSYQLLMQAFAKDFGHYYS